MWPWGRRWCTARTMRVSPMFCRTFSRRRAGVARPTSSSSQPGERRLPPPPSLLTSHCARFTVTVLSSKRVGRAGIAPIFFARTHNWHPTKYNISISSRSFLSQLFTCVMLAICIHHTGPDSFVSDLSADGSGRELMTVPGCEGLWA